MQSLFKLLDSKSISLFHNSPFSFLKEIERNKLTDITVIHPLIRGIKDNVLKVSNIKINKKNIYFIVRFLKWDSLFFNIPTYKIEHIVSDHDNIDILNKAINSFIEQMPENSYYFIDVPTEKIKLLQSLSQTRFKLIETRLNYFLQIRDNNKTRFPVRNSTINDIDALKSVASKMRNVYDRVHADPAFSMELADNYLAKFAEEVVNGFADFVLVPNIKDIEPFGFLAANRPSKVGDKNISKFVLAAIDSSIEKGWLSKLVSEMLLVLKQNGVDYVTTITQSANKAAINVWEKAGFKLYSVSHIYSLKND